ncbi:MAG: ATP-binding protein [Vulcanimicrobiaceae bacterium]
MRVLLVEDNPADALLVEYYLRESKPPAEVVAVDRIQKAIDELRSGSFDAILLDMSLPDGDGLEAVERVRDAASGVPIVILSGQQDEELATDAVQSGAQDYLVKGHVDEIILPRALRYAVERQQLLDRLAASETRLQEENALLRRLADAAGRVFSTLDPRTIVGLLAAELRGLFGGSVALYALQNTELAFVQGDAPASRIDAFLLTAFRGRSGIVDESRGRLGLPIAGTSGRNQWLLEMHLPAEKTFDESDVFALELLRYYIGIAIQNVALFDELQSQRASVLALNQLKDDLIAVLAHDFKGPLTTIIGFAELLEQHLLEDTDSDDALRTIRKSAMRLAALANDTLALSRVEQGELNFANDPVNVGEIMRDIARSMRAQREVAIDEVSSDPVVLGDPARLRQVFENIIGNAIKYSPEGQPVAVRITNDDDSILVAVSDRGIGVPGDEIKFLFERFTRASNAKRSTIKGTGLGLYLAKTLIERHGGSIEVCSALGEGSTFTVALPRVREGVPGILRVLLVTADENLGPFVLHELRANGYTVRRDQTLEAALERLDVETFHLVMIDRDTIADDLHLLHERAAAGNSPFTLVKIGGNPNGKSTWAATLSNPFLTADLHAILGRLQRERVHQTGRI